MFRPDDLLTLKEFPFPDLFAGIDHVWQALPRLAEFVEARVRPGTAGRLTGQPFLGPQVQIGPGTTIEHGAVIKGPAIIGAHCEIRAGAYLRENVIVGDRCVLGNASEFKNAVLFNDVQVPHFSYVGDSILGHQAHLGAGVILSNLKASHRPVVIDAGEGHLETGLVKFGAVLGDAVDVGCNCVLNPGSIIGRGAILYPNVLWRGVCPAGRIVKLRQEHQIVERRTEHADGAG